MPTYYVTHSLCLGHDMMPGHPEQPERLRVVEKALAQPRFEGLVRMSAPEGAFEDIALCHSEHYIDELRHMAPAEGVVFIDGDTSMSPGTWQAALRSVGGAVAAVDAVMTNPGTNAFVAVRPPGHHAEISRSLGFCFFGNVAIAARHAQRKYGIERVAIIDFDVHHGNGTQEIFWGDKTVMYCSTHEMPLFPGTGAARERGDHGTIVNAPLHAGNGSREFREALDIAILPRLESFAPELIVISAGFDAHWRDPLANLELNEDDYVWVTRKLMEIADRSAQGRVVSVLEGGYDLKALHDSVAAHVGALMTG